MPADNLTSPDAEILRAVSLTKDYGEEHAIAGVTFSASAGEVLGIVGPNGAGKTTLLELLAGLIAVDSGGVFWIRETTFRPAAALPFAGLNGVQTTYVP